MSQEEKVVFAVSDRDSHFLATSLDDDSAMTVIALASEDPASWSEMLDAWPRYRTPNVSEFSSLLPFEPADRSAVLRAITNEDAPDQSKSWVFIDIPGRYIFLGSGIQEVGHDAIFAMSEDENGDQHCPLSIHIPPWWQMVENATASQISSPFAAAADRPVINREVLYGDAMLADIAQRAIAYSETEAPPTGENQEPATRHEIVVAIHREWLMTPRGDLCGKHPRQLLYIGRKWNDLVITGQQLRVLEGTPLIALRNDGIGFETGPLGSEEMIMYFDLCRELIAAALHWCVHSKEDSASLKSKAQRNLELIEYLGCVKEEWLYSPFEGGASPSFIIECSRRRVPRPAGVPIAGIDQQQPEGHTEHCDCPICNMLADGMFGLSFPSLDGHHLDLDDEFAFSMHETREEWEEMQREFAAMLDFSLNQGTEKIESIDSGDEDFQPVWASIIQDEPLPGDASGNMKLGFLLSELTSDMQTQDAPEYQIQELLEAFRNYYRADSACKMKSASQFKATLQSLAEGYPDLISKFADLESRIDENLRASSQDGD